ncbi:MAG: hypothetical protein WBP92_05030, partial [Candidatus Acidiferrales bacterium]
MPPQPSFGPTAFAFSGFSAAPHRFVAGLPSRSSRIQSPPSPFGYGAAASLALRERRLVGLG